MELKFLALPSHCLLLREGLAEIGIWCTAQVQNQKVVAFTHKPCNTRTRPLNVQALWRVWSKIYLHYNSEREINWVISLLSVQWNPYFIAELWHIFQNLNYLFSRPLRSSSSTKKSSGHLDIAFNNLLESQSHCYNESREDKKDFTYTTNKGVGIIVFSDFFFFAPFKILNFINHNLTALGPEHTLLLTISQSHILLFQYNLQGTDLW